MQLGERRAARPDHHVVQLRGHRPVHILGGEERDQARHRAGRPARREHRGTVKPETARENGEMAERSLVSAHRSPRRKAREILRLRPLHFAADRAREETDVRDDFEPADKRRGAGFQQARLGRAERHRHLRLHGRALRLPGVGVQAGRDINGEHGNARLIDARDEFDPVRAQRAVEADAEQPVND